MQRESLLRELFGRNPGLGMSFTRLTIGASDFSQSHDSFNDMRRCVRTILGSSLSSSARRSPIDAVFTTCSAAGFGQESVY